MTAHADLAALTPLVLEEHAAALVDLETERETSADLRRTITLREETIREQEARITDLEAALDACEHPTVPLPPEVQAMGVVVPFQIPDYADLDHVFALLTELKPPRIRGRWQSGGRGARVMEFCKANGISWTATFVAEDDFDDPTMTLPRLRSILEADLREALSHPDAPDVLEAVENANEPNQKRGGGAPRSGWAMWCVALSEVFHRVRGDVGATFVILTPAMHATKDDAVKGADWKTLAVATWTDGGVTHRLYFDRVSLHSYQGGGEPTANLGRRVGYINAAFLPLIPPVWLTEYGWMTDPTVQGPKFTPPDVAAGYLARVPAEVIGFNAQIERAFYYEVIGHDRGLYRDGAWEPTGDVLIDLFGGE